MVAREKLYKLRRKSSPLKRVAVSRERYMKKLSDAYFSHLGFKSWERDGERRTPVRAGAMESLDRWFGSFSKNVGRFGSCLAPEAGELARGGRPEELLRKHRRQQVRKFAGAAALAFGLLAGASISANALSRNPWRQQIREQDDDQLNIFSEQEEAAQPVIAKREGYYYMAYIPKGYTQKESHIYGSSFSRTYRKGNKELVIENTEQDLSVYTEGFLVDSFRYRWGEAEVTCLRERSDPENGMAICYMSERIVMLSFRGMDSTELKKIVENLKFFETK